MDDRKSTALHWAAFTGADLALRLILTYDVDLDAQDVAGLTPIHLAVKSAEEIQTTRCVRGLLLKGACPHIKNNEGKLPSAALEDYIKDTPDAIEFAEEIEELLEED